MCKHYNRKNLTQLNSNLGGFKFRLNSSTEKKEVSTDGGTTWENFSSGLDVTPQNITMSYTYYADNPIGGYSAWIPASQFEDGAEYYLLDYLNYEYLTSPTPTAGCDIERIMTVPVDTSQAYPTQSGMVLFHIFNIDKSYIDFRGENKIWLGTPIGIRSLAYKFFKIN